MAEREQKAIAFGGDVYKTDGPVKTVIYIPSTHKLLFLTGVVYDSTNHKLIFTN